MQGGLLVDESASLKAPKGPFLRTMSFDAQPTLHGGGGGGGGGGGKGSIESYSV